MEAINEALELLLNEAKDFCIGTDIAEIDGVPDPIQFAREYYAKQQPVIIRNAVSSWPAVKKWNAEYFLNKFKDKLVDVAVTPNGYADGLAAQNGETFFVLPLEEQISMKEFLERLDNPMGAVNYIQKQNSNLSIDFPELMGDIDMEILKFAEICFNKQPDAMNFWMGDEKAITSMHKDPYDNLYCVISGYKDFILLPPHAAPWIPKAIYPTGVYKREETSGHYVINPIMDKQEDKLSTSNSKNDDDFPLLTEWISIDPLCPDFSKYPEYIKVKPLRVRVNAGDLLFLPNYWYHHVRQSHKTIAVNFWYDMEYDMRYCYFKMLEKLSAFKLK